MTRASKTKIAYQRSRYSREQRQNDFTFGLGPNHAESVLPPIDIVEVHAQYLSCAEAIYRHHQQQSVIPSSLARILWDHTQYSTDITPRQRTRWPVIGAHPGTLDTAGQISADAI